MFLRDILEKKEEIELLEGIVRGSLKRKARITVSTLIKEINDFYSDRQDLIRKLGQEVDGQYTINKESDNFQIFVSELGKMAEAEVHIQEDDRISVEELEEYNISVTAENKLLKLGVITDEA